MAKRNIDAGMQSAGFQTITLSNSTASGLNTTCKLGTWFHLSVETNSVRYRDDGSSPALTTGILLETGLHWLPNIDGANLKFQRQTGTCKVSVQAFKPR